MQGHAHAAGALRAAMRDKELLFSKEQCTKMEGFLGRSKVGVAAHWVLQLPALHLG